MKTIKHKDYIITRCTWLDKQRVEFSVLWKALNRWFTHCLTLCPRGAQGHWYQKWCRKLDCCHQCGKDFSLKRRLFNK